jgi:hypothetical protein
VKSLISGLALAACLLTMSAQAETLCSSHPYLTFSDKHVAQFR